jgi:threonine dehydrogenase-like Zn-dependent dehydrogenase
MRALRVDDRGVRLSAELPPPQPGPGEALVKVTRALVGGSDLCVAGMIPGVPRTAFAGVMGSRAVGVVKAVNLPADCPPALAARKGWVGKRVVVGAAESCAACDLCRRGLPSHCRARRVLGVSGRDGCFAELCAAPLAGLALVPDAVGDDEAVFAYDLASALHAVTMLRSEQSSFITVLGDSAPALLTAQALARMNKTVRLLTGRPERQRLCERWGVKHRAPEEPGRRQDQDVVVDCSGASAGMRLALQLVRPRGVVLLRSPLALDPCPPGRPVPDVGPGSPWATPVDLTPAVVNEVQIVGSRDGPLPDALRALAEDAVDVAGLVTKRFRLDDAPEALRAAAQAEQVAVVIDVG